jgi:flagellar biosynthesis protein FlhF
VAKTLKEAFLQVKAEFGQDAVILKHSKVSKGLFGGPDEYEVTAGIEDDVVGPGKRSPEFPPIRMGDTGTRPALDAGVYGGRSRAQSPLATDPIQSMLSAQPAPAAPPVQPEMPETLTLPPNVRSYFPPRHAGVRPDMPLDEPNQRVEAAGRSRFSSVKRTPDEIAELKADVHELKDLVKSVLTSASSHIVSAPRDEAGVTTAGDMEWDAFVKRLTDAEVKPEIARKLVNSIRGGLQITDAELEDKLFNALSEQFPVSGPIKLKKDAPLVVAFVGPTGSGKTTTLAKLAAYCCMNKSKKVSIITADTYRIAAIEQIRAFADIVNVGLQIVFSPDEVPGALDECGDSDVIFVDNAGRSQRDKEHMEELRILMDMLRPD